MKKSSRFNPSFWKKRKYSKITIKNTLKTTKKELKISWISYNRNRFYNRPTLLVTHLEMKDHSLISKNAPCKSTDLIRKGIGWKAKDRKMMFLSMNTLPFKEISSETEKESWNSQLISILKTLIELIDFRIWSTKNNSAFLM
jgi:hypothetical protein